VMNSTFWLGIQPSLSEDMLNYSAETIESFLGIRF
jgi:CDP-6-deoxy-D-xylo-4-hexulose-3-dehydrase